MKATNVSQDKIMLAEDANRAWMIHPVLWELWFIFLEVLDLLCYGQNLGKRR